MSSPLRYDVENLALPGGRPVGSVGHLAARRFLLGRLQSLGLRPYRREGYEIPYQMEGVQFTNLVARLPGRTSSNGTLLIGAHYDTCGPIPGADDNAAAVAIALEVAKLLQQQEMKRDLVVVLFDAEEPPYFLQPSMGSIRFYEDQRTGPIDCAFILDLVGHDVPVPGLESSLFITGMESHRDLASVVECVPANNAISPIPTQNAYVGDMSDHHVFRKHGIPYLFFSCGRWEHYHAVTDTPDRLNYPKMEALALCLANMILDADKRGFAPPNATYDSTPVELRMMNQVLGPLRQAGWVGLLHNRQDIDALAAKLRRFGL